MIEVDRTIDRDGMVGLGGQRMTIDPPLAGQRVTLRFDGQLMHVISGNRLVKTLPAPLNMARRGKLTGARTSTSPLPPPPFEPLRAVRRVPADGIAMVAGQRLRVGRTYAGQTVTVLIEDTIFRVMLGEVEISTHARTTTKPVTRFKAHARSRSS